MAGEFLPTRDALLLSWSSNFSSLISAGAVSYGLTTSQATAYAALHSAFAAAYATAIEPSTRTRSAISIKDNCRSLLKANARLLARIVQAAPAVTAAQKIDLGLTPRDVNPSPINPPVDPPVLEVAAAVGRTLKLRLRATGTDRRSKPAGVQGASVFSFVGAAAPADISAWTFEGASTRTNFDVTFGPAVPAGAQVWLTAFWYNPRAQSGPACEPVCAYIAGGVSAAA